MYGRKSEVATPKFSNGKANGARPVAGPVTRRTVNVNGIWTIWMDRNNPRGLSKKDFDKNLRPCMDVKSNLDFWEFWDKFIDGIDLLEHRNIRIFRKGVRPTWESTNVDGKWVIPSSKKETHPRLLSCLERMFSDSFRERLCVCGLVLSVRPQSLNFISLWNGLGHDPETIVAMKEELLGILSLESHERVDYLTKEGRVELDQLECRAACEAASSAFQAVCCDEEDEDEDVGGDARHATLWAKRGGREVTLSGLSVFAGPSPYLTNMTPSTNGQRVGGEPSWQSEMMEQQAIYSNLSTCWRKDSNYWDSPSTLTTDSSFNYAIQHPSPFLKPDPQRNDEMYHLRHDSPNIWTPPPPSSRPPLPLNPRPIRIIQRPSIVSKPSAAPPSAKAVAVAQAFSMDCLSRVAAATSSGQQQDSNKNISETYNTLRTIASERAHHDLPNVMMMPVIFRASPAPVATVAGLDLTPGLVLEVDPTVSSNEPLSATPEPSPRIDNDQTDLDLPAAIMDSPPARESPAVESETSPAVESPSLSSAAKQARAARTVLTTVMVRENRKKERKAEKKALKKLEKIKEKNPQGRGDSVESVPTSTRGGDVRGKSSCGRLVAAVAVSTTSALLCFYLRHSLLLAVSV